VSSLLVIIYNNTVILHQASPISFFRCSCTWQKALQGAASSQRFHSCLLLCSPGKNNNEREKPAKQPKKVQDDPEKARGKALDAVCAKLDKNQKTNIQVS